MQFIFRMMQGFALNLSAILILSTFALTANAVSEKDNRMITNGGSRLDGVIRKVSSLADRGPGTLREVLTGIDRPTIVVFEVGGAIALSEDIYIRSSNVTIAGQTAPEPGITLTGASLRVRADDIAIEHIAIRPGMSAKPAERADGLTIGGGSRPIERVRVRNISVSWSKDELISVARPTNGPVSITHSIFAEALKFAGHPKGNHSMAMLVRDAPQGIVVAGNLFISNVHRNPALASNTKAKVSNNWIINPRYNAIHMYLNKDSEKLVIDVRNNAMTPGLDTAGTTRPVSMPPEEEILAKGVQITSFDNHVIARKKILKMGLSGWTPNQPATTEMSTLQVPTHVLRYAGMRPLNRNYIDQRILDDALAGLAAVVDRPPDKLALTPSRRIFKGPERPFEQDPLGNTRIELWLEQLHLEKGGAPGIDIGLLPLAQTQTR